MTTSTPDRSQLPPPDPDEDEVVHYDDATIGRAFRGSLIALAALGLVALAGFLIFKRHPAPALAPLPALAAPAAPAAPSVEPPVAHFTDITREAGIHFVHSNGARGEKLLPETMGGGAAWFDADGDDDPDLLFVNSTWWPWDPERSRNPPPTLAFYRNDGGHFVDATQGSGLDVPLYGMGAAAADYDNDGKIDVFITAVGGNRLFHNQGGAHFQDVTATAGVAGTPEDWSTCSTWIDIDNDGDLDLFVGNYIRWSRQIDIEVNYTLVGVGRAYGPPNNFQGAFPYLYRNEGHGKFTDISASSGIQIRNPATGVPVAKPLGVAPVDFDQDGLVDLVVANDTVQNFAFRNRGNGTFAEVGALAGIAFDSYGNTRGAMGIDAACFRNDLALGIAIGNFANEMTALYVAQNTATNFADEAITEGVGPASRLLLKFGVFFFDYDLDGWLDLLTANGHLEEEISKVQQSQSYAQPAQLFWNAGGAGQSGFIEVNPAKAGGALFTPIVGRGGAYADIDSDGDLDILLTQVAGPPLLLRNDQHLQHHWLRVKLVGTRANRDAIGARLTVHAGNLSQSRLVSPTHGYLSQSELVSTFGLGTLQHVDSIEIVWPGGPTQSMTSVPVDQTLTITQSH